MDHYDFELNLNNIVRQKRSIAEAGLREYEVRALPARLKETG